MTDLVTVTDEGPVRTIRMNRPEKKNALTMAMYDAMADGIETASAANIRAFSTRSHAARRLWSPPCKAMRSASAPRC